MSAESFYKGKNILITGGLGFIGSTLAMELVRFGADVTLIDALIEGYGGNRFNIDSIKDQVTVHIADVRNEAFMHEMVQDRDLIFNLAGTLSHIDSMENPITDLQINCVSQLSILESCRKVNPDVKILFAGTRGQYGRPETLPVTEEHPMRPIDINGIHNMAAEWYHILYNNTHNIRACSLRLTNTYGPRHQMKHSRQGIINWFTRLLMEGKTVRLFGDGKQIRDANYIDDVVSAFLIAGYQEKTNGQVYNLGGQPASLIDIVKTLVEIIGKGDYEFVEFPDKMKSIEVGDYVADHSKIKNEIGWKPQTNLREGLEKTVRFYSRYSKYYF